MKIVILAGGIGTRLSEETELKPKPMVTIGGKPILWHIMKIYSSYGFNEFIICCGHKGYVIKEYFANYYMHLSDVTFDMVNNKMEVLENYAEPWRVTLIDTGEDTMTGGRLKRIYPYVKDEELFCFTYGDGVGNINIKKLIEFHQKSGTLCTLTASLLPGRFGALTIDGSHVRSFSEKPKGDEGLINGGFFVASPKILNYIDNDDSTWEKEPLENLARDGELSAYQHTGYWQPMDTIRDKKHLEELWDTGQGPWKTW